MTGQQVLWLSTRAATYPENPTIQYNPASDKIQVAIGRV